MDRFIDGLYGVSPLVLGGAAVLSLLAYEGGLSFEVAVLVNLNVAVLLLTVIALETIHGRDAD